ncbi:hypothetical protein TeGR_g13730, partial [Tetraparma gracilis]
VPVTPEATLVWICGQGDDYAPPAPAAAQPRKLAKKGPAGRILAALAPPKPHRLELPAHTAPVAPSVELAPSDEPAPAAPSVEPASAAPSVEPCPAAPAPEAPAPVVPALLALAPLAPAHLVPAPPEPAPLEPAPPEPALLAPAPPEPAPLEPAPLEPAPPEPAPLATAPPEPAPLATAPLAPAPLAPAPPEPALLALASLATAPRAPAPPEPAPLAPAPAEPSLAPFTYTGTCGGCIANWNQQKSQQDTQHSCSLAFCSVVSCKHSTNVPGTRNRELFCGYGFCGKHKRRRATTREETGPLSHSDCQACSSARANMKKEKRSLHTCSLARCSVETCTGTGGGRTFELFKGFGFCAKHASLSPAVPSAPAPKPTLAPAHLVPAPPEPAPLEPAPPEPAPLAPAPPEPNAPPLGAGSIEDLCAAFTPIRFLTVEDVGLGDAHIKSVQDRFRAAAAEKEEKERAKRAKKEEKESAAAAKDEKSAKRLAKRRVSAKKRRGAKKEAEEKMASLPKEEKELAKKAKALADAAAAAAKKEEKESAAAAKKEEKESAAAAKKEEKERAKRAKDEKRRAAAAKKEKKERAKRAKDEKRRAAAAKKEKKERAKRAKDKKRRAAKETELAKHEREWAEAVAEKEMEKESDAEKAVTDPLREILSRCLQRRDDLVLRFRAFSDKNGKSVGNFLSARGASIAGEHEVNAIASDARQLAKVLETEREFKVEVQKALAKPLLADAKTPSPQARKVMQLEKGREAQMEDDALLGLSAVLAASRLRTFTTCQDAAFFQSNELIDKNPEISRLDDLFHADYLGPEQSQLSQLSDEDCRRLIKLHADFFGDMLTANERRILDGVDFTADFMAECEAKFGDKTAKVMESLRRAELLVVPNVGSFILYPSTSCLCAFCTGAAGSSFCHLGDLVRRQFDRTFWVDGRGRVFSREAGDEGELKERAATYAKGYANVTATFSSNFIPLPYKSEMKLATLQWAGVMGPSFILSETCDHLVEDKNKNGIADTQPVDKAENMKRSNSNRKRKREKAAEGEDGGGGGGE